MSMLLSAVPSAVVTSVFFLARLRREPRLFGSACASPIDARTAAGIGFSNGIASIAAGESSLKVDGTSICVEPGAEISASLERGNGDIIETPAGSVQLQRCGSCTRDALGRFVDFKVSSNPRLDRQDCELDDEDEPSAPSESTEDDRGSDKDNGAVADKEFEEAAR